MIRWYRAYRARQAHQRALRAANSVPVRSHGLLDSSVLAAWAAWKGWG